MRTIVVLMDTLRRDHLSCYNENTDCITENIKFMRKAVYLKNHFTEVCLVCQQEEISLLKIKFLERSWGQ